MNAHYSYLGRRGCRGLLLAVAWLLCAAAPAYSIPDTVVTGALDSRSYRYLELDNGLRALLVSDPQTDKSAASLDVAVGHGSDPEGREGLAHFLEHMLFLGTRKYPEAGEYQAYISDHGGNHNAYTTYDHTNYFFSVRPEYLDGALDRFSQFFVAPLFNEDLVKRERVIVHSEYSARSDDEGRRTFAARRRAMNPAHPRSRFAVGSLSTLADRDGSTVRDELIAFYQENYSAHLMVLSVIGREGLDVLESWVRERFAAVGRSEAARFVSDEPIYVEERLPSLLQVRPLRDMRQLSFTFELPSTIDSYRAKPLHQISNIVGHEGDGSLLAALKTRGWAQGLSAGPGAMDSARGTMEVAIDLTAAGVDHVAEIGEMLFDFIRLIEERGVEGWRFEEQKKLAGIGFRYGEKTDPMTLVQMIASRLHDYPWQHVLYAPYAFEEYDPILVREYLGYLNPRRVAVTLVAPGVEVDEEEPWYGTEYSLKPLPDALLDRWREPRRVAELELPGPNPFVPERFALVDDADAADTPVAIVDTEGLHVWHRTVTGFGSPRAEFYVSFRSPRAVSSPADSAYTDLFTEVIKDRLNTFSYPAYLAGLGYEVYPHLRGFSLRISGFNDRQATLLKRIVGALRTAEFDQARFERLRAGLLDDYRNRLKDSPSRLAVSELQRLLIESATPLSLRIAALEDATFENFKAFTGQFFARGSALVLSVGNRLPDEAASMAGIVEDILLAGVEPLEVSRGSVVRLTPDRHYQRAIDSRHQDSVVGLYIQGRGTDYEERARFYLYDQLSGADFYHSLRTEQKLGYIVQSFAFPVINVPGMMFLVQSPSVDAQTTESAIRRFMVDFAKTLEGLDAERLRTAKDALLSRINQRDDTLSDLADRYWRELDEEEYEFDSRDRLSRALEAITIEDMREFTQRISSEFAGSLVIRSGGDLSAPASAEELLLSRSKIVDPSEFKREHPVF